MRTLSIAQSLAKEKLASIKAEMKRLAEERTAHHLAAKACTDKITRLGKESRQISDEMEF